jgi:hypothetical protein
MFSRGEGRGRNNGWYAIQGAGRGEFEIGCTSTELQLSLTFFSPFQQDHL